MSSKTYEESRNDLNLGWLAISFKLHVHILGEIC